MSKEIRRKVKDTNKKSIIILCIQLLLILVIIFCLIKIIFWFINSKKESETNTKLTDEVVKIYTNTNVDIYTHDEKEVTKVAVDFEKLKQINPDIIGWIIIDGTNINYPILKAEDNDYYLHRNYLKEYSQSGSIFLDYENLGLYDKNILIYGHNMSDGLMFHQLSKIFNGELGDKIYVKILTDKEERTYSVFSTYMVDPDEFSNIYNFDILEKNSIINFNYNSIDKNSLLTLYTCNLLGDKRIIVHCVLSNITKNN